MQVGLRRFSADHAAAFALRYLPCDAVADLPQTSTARDTKARQKVDRRHRRAGVFLHDSSAYEVSSKADVYEAVKGYRAFLRME